MSDKQRKSLFIVGGAVAALLVVVLLLLLLWGGSGNKDKTYDRFYAAAEDAYFSRDYETALKKLNKAKDVKETAEIYLLMADIYYAEGDTERALQVLTLGSSHVGGAEIHAMLERLKGHGAEPVDEPVPDSAPVVGGMDVRADATSLVLTGRALSEQDLAALGRITTLESLSISGCGVRSIDALSGLKNLTFLQVSDNEFSDLSPISGLENLKTLYIDDNPITDFSPLYPLTALRTLSMKQIPVTDTQLKALKKALPKCSVYADEPTEEAVELTLGGRRFKNDVTELNLGGLGITDVSVLSECPHLKRLDLRDNAITDISPLLDLQELEWLCLWNNEVEDIYPLMTLNRLQYLDLDGNSVRDISVLGYLPALEELWLGNNELRSLNALKQLTGLRRLGLENTALDDGGLDALMGLTTLTELNVKGNEGISAEKFEALREALPDCLIAHDELLYSVSLGGKPFLSDAEEISAIGVGVDDLSGLENFRKLKTLRLDVNHVSDLSPLRELEVLQELHLYGNSVSDLTPLDGHGALQILDLKDNFVSDLSPLAGCRHLRELSLAGNAVNDLTPLAACTELTSLDLDGNSISSISALAPLTSLTVLHLENNDVTDLSALYSLVKLETLYIRGNDLTPDDIQALQTMLPHCLIVHDVEFPPEASAFSDAEPMSHAAHSPAG